MADNSFTKEPTTLLFVAFSKDHMYAAHELNGEAYAHAILTTDELLVILSATQEGE